MTCNFISTAWSRVWFSNQHYSERNYEDLKSAITEVGCAKSLKCFETHWVRDPSLLDVPRSNILAERAVKLMEEVQSKCKTDKYLNNKFINCNTQI